MTGESVEASTTVRVPRGALRVTEVFSDLARSGQGAPGCMGVAVTVTRTCVGVSTADAEYVSQIPPQKVSVRELPCGW